MSASQMTPDELRIMGRRWKGAREIAGYTQVDSAELLGVSQSAVSQYERGETEPKASVAYNAARLFNVSMAWLLGFSDDMRV